METEVFSFGKLPLAFSARCFTARYYGLNKDDCQFKCLDHSEGMLVKTREKASFLTLNGIQTMSAQSYNLLAESSEMLALGIDALRISPQPQHTLAIVDAFRSALDNADSMDGLTRAESPDWAPHGYANGYWFGQAGFEHELPTTKGEGLRIPTP